MRDSHPDNDPRPSAEPDCCSPESECCEDVGRRRFFQLAGLASAAAVTAPATPAPPSQLSERGRAALDDAAWPVLQHYDRNHIAHIALPLGGIGTGSVSLCGNGSLRDWEIMNRPAKGFTPSVEDVEPFFALHVSDGEQTVTRVIEGPVAKENFEGSHGSRAPNVNLPRFRNCEFAASYPFGRVMLSDDDVPVEVHLKAFSPLVPADTEASGIPLAVLTFELRNRTKRTLQAAVCGSLPNFIGMDGWRLERDWKGDLNPAGASKNRNRLRHAAGVTGLFLDSAEVDARSEAWGTIALATTATNGVTHRTSWIAGRWGTPLLEFWDDFSADGAIEERHADVADAPFASLAVATEVPAGGASEVTFLLAWRFPNRYGWDVDPGKQTSADRVGNYYCTQYNDAWDVILKTLPRLSSLKQRTRNFVRAFLDSPLPEEVKEAALFNISTHHTQTCFRTEDGRFYGWEGCADRKGCCNGSCTHVWNYEQATAFLHGELALSMREIEFAHSTDERGLMSFRTRLPLATRAQEFGRAAADGQMGCIMKMYRDWRLSGDDEQLRALWPHVRRALEFCWIPGGWDADRDGVMEGVQHNTMDVEYYGPNPQMTFWYLGALRAAGEMASYLGDDDFAATCRPLFERGSAWIDEHLFNGEYYEHHVRPVEDASLIPKGLVIGMGARNLKSPDYQLAGGCLVDQLVGQFMAHVCGLGYLAKRENIRTTLASIRKYNHRDNLYDHFNPLRSFALDGEAGLLMADYPKERPAKPFPYFGEVMTGFEYTAAIGMLYEGMTEEGLAAIRDVRARYDGRKRSPFDEAECGHHYARAMASWAAVLALTGFEYSAVEKSMTFAPKPGRWFWSNGYAWGVCELRLSGGSAHIRLEVLEGRLELARFHLSGFGESSFGAGKIIEAKAPASFVVEMTE